MDEFSQVDRLQVRKTSAPHSNEYHPIHLVARKYENSRVVEKAYTGYRLRVMFWKRRLM